MDKVRLVFLGGQDEHYKSMTAVEINGDIFVIEAGLRLPDKTKPGIDYVIPRYDYLVENKDRVKGYFLTHGYDSIMGSLPYIYEKVPAPIFCTTTTSDFLSVFCQHSKLDFSKLAVNIVKGGQDIVLAGRKISFFDVSCNFAESIGICIGSTQGNIIYISHCVYHNDFDNGFIFDRQKLGKLCENKTLVLLSDAIGSDKVGYCAPNYNLMHVLNQDIFDREGRIFVAIDTPNLYNIIKIINTAVSKGRKILCYDERAQRIIDILLSEGRLNFKNDSIVSIEEVNRLRPKEVCVFMTGFVKELNNKIMLLATKNNDEKIVFLKEDDTFIYGALYSEEFETIITETIDELYRTGCEVIRPSKEYAKMNAHEEDLKAILSVVRPTYFVPVTAPFVKLLSAAMIALNMNIGLNHNNVFIVDNGNIIEFEAGFGKILPNKVITGDVFVDGKGIGDIGQDVLEERQKMADDGVILLGITISKSIHEIVAGPDIQARGLIFLKDNESLMKEITKLFISTVNTELAKENYSITYLEQNVKDVVFRAIRRSINKTPMIIPVITEIN